MNSSIVLSFLSSSQNFLVPSLESESIMNIYILYSEYALNSLRKLRFFFSVLKQFFDKPTKYKLFIFH